MHVGLLHNGRALRLQQPVEQVDCGTEFQRAWLVADKGLTLRTWKAADEHAAYMALVTGRDGYRAGDHYRLFGPVAATEPQAAEQDQYDDVDAIFN